MNLNSHASHTSRSRLAQAASKLPWLPALAAFVSGCAHMMNVNVKPATLAASTKSPARIALVLNKSFTSFTDTRHMMGDTYVSRLGPALEDYAKNVTQNVFGEVSVYPSAAEAAGKADAILTPKVLKFDESYGVWAGSDHQMVMIIKWTMMNRDDQRFLWLDSIEARGEGKMGNLFTYKKNHLKVLQRLFNDLGAKTQKALLEIPEVKPLSSGGGQQPAQRVMP